MARSTDSARSHAAAFGTTSRSMKSAARARIAWCSSVRERSIGHLKTSGGGFFEASLDKLAMQGCPEGIYLALDGAAAHYERAHHERARVSTRASTSEEE